MRSPFARILGIPLLLLACDPGHDEGGDGELRVGLWGDAPSGQTYSLQEAIFVIDNNWGIFTDDLPDGSASAAQALPEGSHTLLLADGWQVVRGAEGEAQPTLVDAELLTPNPLEIIITDKMVTNVTYVFQIEGEHVPFVAGSVDVDVDFQEDDGICVPESYDEQDLAAANGNAVDHGDGWQSFTMTQTAIVGSLWIDWTDEWADTYAIEIHEGVGPDGALLGTIGFWDVAPETAGVVSTQIGFPNSSIELAQGGVYTLVSEGAYGWVIAAGAIPGATSSEGNANFRPFRLRGLICD
ncbi:MAG TPA: hypothetical protein VG755_25040 [Nannocystaceae bacterium]|nr:hypothetical protein [Nannocystaceae bacterium]